LELLLEESGTRVHVVDNLSSNPISLEDLLRELGKSPRLSYSITTVQEYCSAKNRPRFHEIYHLASVVGPAGVLPHAGRIAPSIVNDTIAVSELAMEDGAKLVDVSTSEVYGGGEDGFCSEEMPKIVPNCISARLEYAVGKLAAEMSVLNRSQVGGLDVRIVRPFNITGPRQSGKGGFVLPRFIGQAMTENDITVFHQGQQVRAFTHVRDVAEGIRLALRRGRLGEIYNLGNGANRSTIRGLAEHVLRIVGSNSKIVFMDPKDLYGPLYEEASNKFPDATKAATELDWTPQYDSEAVIRSTHDYFKGLSPDNIRDLTGIEPHTQESPARV
jgi:UDP-glucose 4-epimerase